MLTLLPTILLICGKVNFSNLSRYSELSERTYRRHYHQPFAFMGLNAGLIAQAIPASAVQIGVMDCSFIRKSGKGTAGLDWFYNGSASRSERGLEISVFAVVERCQSALSPQGYGVHTSRPHPPTPSPKGGEGKLEPADDRIRFPISCGRGG